MKVNPDEPTVSKPKDASGARRPWVAPAVEPLPPLSELTLQSPIGPAIGGSGGSGGTVF
ncbi:MAG TPA: hypothetical protein VF212_12080 [Longimicrobiales bacterium]